MPLELPDQRFFEAACGYLQLAMPLEANEELEKIDPFNKAAPEVLALRVEIYRKLKKWELMREIAKRLNDFQRMRFSGFFHMRLQPDAPCPSKLQKKFCANPWRNFQKKQRFSLTSLVTSVSYGSLIRPRNT